MLIFQEYLKDNFDGPELDESAWSLVQGGHIGEGCDVLVSGQGLHFSTSGIRQAVTVDLDLRDAR